MTAYVDTYYKRTLSSDAAYPALSGRHDVDVCIVGGGLAGLTTALELARRGHAVTVAEARRVAWGASGRNGGFVSPGWAARADQIRRLVGIDHAKALFRLSMEGVSMVVEAIRDLGIADANVRAGILRVSRYENEAALKIQRDEQEAEFGRKLRLLSRDEVRSLLVSKKYHEGLLDEGSFHFHPLNYARALAREIVRLGGSVHEDTPIVSADLASAEKRLRTPAGEVRARTVVLAGGGYTDSIAPSLRRSFLPIATYVVLSELAPELIAGAIRTQAGVSDGRRAGDYYRVVDGMLLWGGRITTRTTDPRDIAAVIRHEMVTTYPQLEGLKVEAAWSGLMAYARHLMPLIGPVMPNVWSCTAFGGHGLNTTAIGARVVAEAISGDSDRYRLFEPFGFLWNGGPFGTAAVQLTYWAYQGMDFLREWRSARA
ncbi:FAD-binding oxidoreductase [Mesorhizobium sp. WSM4976]|uniref:NAD(P)/FAD-dependent oxidoreductase n=1 Tax=Mesorhizobium sp. WSM4976 TaxID=3038549 RepID=UPI002415FB16|nr:FAD-binding oxidoreductase [Mesorhizobium sp. WSM4976]MDG4897513.1 FAD-binding oxidoreductase [Mesorhizobium sp. WSM4976]